MPRYFFHILHPGEALVADEEGQECADVAAARQEAILSFRDLAADQIKRGENVSGLVIEVMDGSGRRVEAVHAADILH